MNILKEWFNEVLENNMEIYSSKESEYLIYRGFKLSRSFDGEYKIQDVRLSDFYDDVKDRDYKILVKLGFIRGGDWIVNKRNIKRVQTYTRIIEKLYDDKRDYQSKLRPRKTRAFYQKKLRNCQENIHKTIDLLFLYKSRINQYNSKYNINVEKIKN